MAAAGELPEEWQASGVRLEAAQAARVCNWPDSAIAALGDAVLWVRGTESPDTGAQPSLAAARNADGGGFPGQPRLLGDPIRRGDDCLVHVTVTSLPGGELIESTRDSFRGVLTGGAEEPRRLVLGGRNSPPAVELALSRALVGGQLRVAAPMWLAVPPLPTAEGAGAAKVCAPWTVEGVEWAAARREHAPGRRGWVALELDVVSANVALPPVPEPAVLAAAKARREVEERRRFLEEDAPPSWEERVEAADRGRLSAEADRRAGRVADAVRSLNSAFAHLLYSTDEERWRPASAEQLELAAAARGRLHSDRAACHLRLGSPGAAAWDAAQACKGLAEDRAAMLRLAAARLDWTRGGLLARRDARRQAEESAGEGAATAAAAAAAVGSERRVQAAHGKHGSRLERPFDPELAAVPLLLAARLVALAARIAPSPRGSSAAPHAAPPAATVAAARERAGQLLACARWHRGQSDDTAEGGTRAVPKREGRRGADAGMPVDELGRLAAGDDVDALDRLKRSVAKGAWGEIPGLSGAPRTLWARAVALRDALTHELSLGMSQRRIAFAQLFGKLGAAAQPAVAQTSPEAGACDSDGSDDSLPPLE